MSPAPGVLFRWSMPDPEQRALDRVAAARGTMSNQVVEDAIGAYLAAGKPAISSNPPPCPLDAESLAIWRIVRWWLRRPPATEVLSPALLAGERRTAEAVRDAERLDAALLQLCRIGGDLWHPQRREAIGLVLAMIPEPARSRVRQVIGGAEAAATFKARGGTA